MATAAWAYHDATRHSLASVRASQHRLDFANQPLPFKIYTDLEPIPLPREFAPSAGTALEAIGGTLEPDPALIVDRTLIARLCYYANGVTRLLRRPGGTVPFRAAACTGALYHIELYLVCQDLADLAAGVYHYAAHDHALRRLRSGDFRAALAAATGAEPHISDAPVVLVATSTFWRNAWKYQARAYRHSFWDCGTVLANLLAVSAAQRLAAHTLVGFADALINELLDVDPSHEAALCLVSLGLGGRPVTAAPPLVPLDYPTQQLSAYEVEYPAIAQMHAASALADGAAVAAWRNAGSAPVDARPPTPATPPIEQVITRRGSARQFSRAPISREALDAMLQVATGPMAVDFGGPLTTPYLIVNAVDGLAPGSYVFDARLQPLRPGSFREVAGFLDLGQQLAADSAVNVYSLSNLHDVLPRLGDRGYRAAQLEGAIQGGKLYLAAYALGLGATGLTFFDDEVSRFFAPHAADKSVMFLTALGHPARSSR